MINVKVSQSQTTFFLFSILPKNALISSYLGQIFCKYFVHFLEELRTRKIASEIIWSLVTSNYKWKMGEIFVTFSEYLNFNREGINAMVDSDQGT